MRKAYICAALTTVLAGCASGQVVHVSESDIDAPREIALQAPAAPWVVEIETRLKQQGFDVLRWDSHTRVTEQTSDTRAGGKRGRSHFWLNVR